MNKKLTAAYEARKANPADANAAAELAELAVPKFKEVYGRIQKAVRTINRHLGVNKGNPNRATMAMAIGLADELNQFVDVAAVLPMGEMETAAKTALDTIGKIRTMRAAKKYEHLDVLPDFYTAKELEEKSAVDAKLYLFNVTNALRAAIDTIDRHVADGSFDPNTFKVAKAIGYGDEFPSIRASLTEQADIDAYDAAYKTLGNVILSKSNGYQTAVAALAEYNPFPEEEDSPDCDDGEE